MVRLGSEVCAARQTSSWRGTHKVNPPTPSHTGQRAEDQRHVCRIFRILCSAGIFRIKLQVEILGCWDLFLPECAEGVQLPETSPLLCGLARVRCPLTTTVEQKLHEKLIGQWILCNLQITMPQRPFSNTILRLAACCCLAWGKNKENCHSTYEFYSRYILSGARDLNTAHVVPRGKCWLDERAIFTA